MFDFKPAVSRRASETRTRLFRPTSLILFALLVFVGALAVTWQYGWPNFRTFSDSFGEARAQLQSAALMMRGGQYRDAQKLIAPILANPGNPLYRSARWMRWQIAQAQTLAIPPQSPRRRRAEAGTLPILDGMLKLGGWTPEQWRALAQGASAVGAYGFSARFWEQAALADPALSWQDRREAALALAAKGDPAAAAQILLDLAAETRNPSWQEALLFQGAKWLEGGLGSVVALARCRALLARAPRLWQDRQVVMFMARLALAADRPDLAARWLYRELRQRGTPRPS